MNHWRCENAVPLNFEVLSYSVGDRVAPKYGTEKMGRVSMEVA